MTHVVVLELKDRKMPDAKVVKRKIAQMIEGAVNADGSWKKGWEPALLQAYLRKESPGVYTFVHNLNRKDYSLSHNTLREGGTFIRHMGEAAFTVETHNADGEIVDLDWRFAISVIGD